MRLTLAMADAPRYLVQLGDTEQLPENPLKLQLIPLARPEATIAAVRYVQLPLWREWGITASAISLSIGKADLLATLGDPTLAARALPEFARHAAALAAELPTLCAPDATLQLLPVPDFQSWEWAGRFAQTLTEAFGRNSATLWRTEGHEQPHPNGAG